MKLQLQNVSKIYPSGNQAVCDMNLTVNEGELVVLVKGNRKLPGTGNRRAEAASGDQDIASQAEDQP